MKTAIYCVSKNAIKIAGKINLDSRYNCDIYIASRLFDEKKEENNNFIIMDGNLKETVKDTFNKYDLHIFIMATGIVVRVIAEFIKTKDIDPAVLVVDEQGNFTISLLSGHLGGANEECKYLSDVLKNISVITTASDVSGKIAVDTLSQKLNAKLDDLESAKRVTALIVNGEKVKLLLPENIIESESPVSGAVIVSNKKKIEITKIIPQNIVLGIGCKRDTPKKEIMEFITKVMEDYNLDMKSIRVLASAWVKEDEAGLLSACEELGKNITFFKKEEILEVEKILEIQEKSEFVKKQIGVSAVSEPCAYLASNKNGDFIVRKLKNNGITISIYEEYL